MKLIFSYINFFLLSILFFACTQKSNNQNNSSNDAEIKVNNPESDKVESVKEEPTQRYQLSKIAKVEISSLKKTVDQESAFYSEYASLCSNWKLDSNDLAEVIMKSKNIDGHTFQYFFSILPCYYSGELQINDSINAKFEINSGSSSILTIGDTSLFLGYYDKKIKFLSEPGIE